MATERKGKGHISLARHIVQVLVLALFCIPPLAVGQGLFGVTSGSEELAQTASTLPFFGSLSSSTIAGLVLADPFAVLETIVASKDVVIGSVVGALPILLLYGIVRGRAFCGWACPVNLVLEPLVALRAKLGIKVREHGCPRHVKLWVALGALVVAAITGQLVWEAVNPISLFSKGLLFGSLTGLATFVGIIVVDLVWGHRVWCRALCPLGGFYEALGTVGTVSVKMDYDACIHCDRCKQVCLCDPEILDGVLSGTAKRVEAGDCMLCGKCVDTCPTKALSIGFAAPTRTKKD